MEEPGEPREIASVPCEASVATGVSSSSNSSSSREKSQARERVSTPKSGAQPHSIAQLDQRLVKQLNKLQESLLRRNGKQSLVRDGDLEFDSWLGHGSFSSANLCVSSKTNEQLVVKEVPLLKLTSFQAIDQLATEVKSCSRLHHPHIVRLRSAYLAGTLSTTSARTLKIVLEYAAGGTLEQRIIKVRQRGSAGRFPTRLVEVWLSQLTSAMLYMHRKNVLHRDLSSKSIPTRRARTPYIARGKCRSSRRAWMFAIMAACRRASSACLRSHFACSLSNTFWS